MNRKLVCLITPQGKTDEELTQAVWDAFQKYQKTGEITLDLYLPDKTEEVIKQIKEDILSSTSETNSN